MESPQKEPLRPARKRPQQKKLRQKLPFGAPNQESLNGHAVRLDKQVKTLALKNKELREQLALVCAQLELERVLRQEDEVIHLEENELNQQSTIVALEGLALRIALDRMGYWKNMFWFTKRNFNRRYKSGERMMFLTDMLMTPAAFLELVDQETGIGTEFCTLVQNGDMRKQVVLTGSKDDQLRNLKAFFMARGANEHCLRRFLGNYPVLGSGLQQEGHAQQCQH